MRYWKVLDDKGHACHGGTFAYDLPKNGKPGTWTPRIPNIEACNRGYHVCRDADLVHWCNGATIYACEVQGKVIAQDDKVVAESIRLVAPTPWDAVTARLFAVECAADVMHLAPGSDAVLEVAYRYALGDATQGELDAAWGAARGAVWDAARGAAWGAAWGAARDAARGAAYARHTARLLWWIGASADYPQGDK